MNAEYRVALEKLFNQKTPTTSKTNTNLINALQAGDNIPHVQIQQIVVSLNEAQRSKWINIITQRLSSDNAYQERHIAIDHLYALARYRLSEGQKMPLEIATTIRPYIYKDLAHDVPRANQWIMLLLTDYTGVSSINKSQIPQQQESLKIENQQAVLSALLRPIRCTFTKKDRTQQRLFKDMIPWISSQSISYPTKHKILFELLLPFINRHIDLGENEQGKNLNNVPDNLGSYTHIGLNDQINIYPGDPKTLGNMVRIISYDENPSQEDINNIITMLRSIFVRLQRGKAMMKTEENDYRNTIKRIQQKGTDETKGNKIFNVLGDLEAVLMKTEKNIQKINTDIQYIKGNNADAWQNNNLIKPGPDTIDRLRDVVLQTQADPNLSEDEQQQIVAIASDLTICMLDKILAKHNLYTAFQDVV